MSYRYRNLPCNIAPDDSLWCVSGHDNAHHASGVLEWCYNELDARRVLRDMQASSGRFSNLSAHKFNTEGKGRISGLIDARMEGGY
jgi:hypothetical protein